MGCDIHMYVEHRRQGQKGDWSSWGSRINPGRNYDVFSLLAGVRGSSSKSMEPRGIPDDIGYYAKNDNQLYITEKREDTEGTCSLEDAKRYELSCGSKIIYQGDKPVWVTHPDWHSHSWVTPDELEKVLALSGKEPEYEALLAAMRKFEEYGHEARVVFWFDN